MRKHRAILLISVFVLSSAFLASCSLKDEEKPKLMFNEGYLEEIVLGEPIMLDEYIDPELTSDYTAILTQDETGIERNLKDLVQWTADKPGTYTLNYTVNSGKLKGSISTKITVVPSEISWTYTPTTVVYRTGETMSFNAFKRLLNISVNSYYDYEFFMKDVTYNGKAEDLRDKTSYTFPEDGTFTFRFGVVTEDGQMLQDKQEISVRKAQVLGDGAEEWMTNNGITACDYTYISSDGEVRLDAGYYTTSIVRDRVPYIAFNGKNGSDGYGSDTYVVTEFTGKNLPQIAFFCNDVKPSFTDGSQGILFFNAFAYGHVNREPHPSRMAVFGPNKVGYGELDNKGRFTAIGSSTEPCPASWNALDENCKYRYIIGIENAQRTKMTARILLINLTTSERVWDYSYDLNKYTTAGGSQSLNLDDDFYSGSIVLYGLYGYDLTLDKVYLPYTDIDSIYDLDKAAEFKDDFKKNYALGASAKVSDYINTTGDYSFKVIDPDGLRVEIDALGNFSYDKSGEYRLYYSVNDKKIRDNTTTVRVMYDLYNEFAPDYFEKEGAIKSFASSTIVVPNTNEAYIKEGSQSLRYYTANPISEKGTFDVFIAKDFMEFVNLSRDVEGISFEIYALKDLTYCLKKISLDETHPAYLKEDYTGNIPKETWTKITLSRELMLKNYETYLSTGYSIAVSLISDVGFAGFENVYIDNIQLLVNKDAKEVDSNTLAFMENNNITAYGYESINPNNSITLGMGYYDGEPKYGSNKKMANDNVPYLAYNGSYGINDYIVVDFTGKDIPQLCFFAKEVTSSLIDGKAGFYLHTGIVKQNGDILSVFDCGRVTCIGPNKIEYCSVDNTGRMNVIGYTNDNPIPSPFSVNGLVDGVHYRYVVGVKSAKAKNIVFDMLLINLDTGEEVARTEFSNNGSFDASYLTDTNIILYGRYNKAITIDKFYTVYQDVTDINQIDKVSEILGE